MLNKSTPLGPIEVGTLLPSQIQDFCSEILENMADYYLCRSGSDGAYGSNSVCGYFGPPTQWAATSLHTLDGGHWRCPVCGQQYRPWQAKPSYFAGNKILVVEALHGDVTTPTGEVLKQGGVRYIPFVWADTRTTGLTGALKDIHLRDQIQAAIQETATELAEQSEVSLLKKVQQIAFDAMVKKSYWQTMTLSPQALHEITECNKRGKEVYQFDHLQPSFVGTRYIWTPGEAVMDQTQTAKMWATVRMTVHCAMRAQQERRS
jgi:hypothetical protein